MELVLTGIRKDFGEKKVLRDVSCTFEKGKIYGLLAATARGKPPCSTAWPGSWIRTAGRPG